jgi:hypothetical protein
MPARALWLTSAVFALAVGTAQAQTLDFASTPHGSTTGARGAVAVDLNRDGWLDLATANTGRNTVAVLLNRGDGAGFAPPFEIPVGAGPFDIATGDLDKDGIPDLVVATPDAHAIEVLRLRDDGHLASRAVVAGGSEARGLTLADVTGDGILDLVYTDYARNRVVLMPGTDGGGFGLPLADVAVSAKPQGVVAGDFNHDGTIDLAVASTGSSTLDVLYRNSLGEFTRRSIAAGRPLNVLTVADMNADGWDDIAAAATSSNLVVVFKGAASGFTVAGTRPVGASPRGIASGDFNEDGRPDLATGNYDGGSATVLLGRRDGSVLPDVWGNLPSGAGARAVATGDFNNDGRLDLAIGAQSLSRVWVHQNATAFIAPASSFRTQDVFLSQAPSDVADFNENGAPDIVADHTILIDGTSPVRLDVDPLAVVIASDAADYDHDGHQDVLLATVSYDAQGRQVSRALDLWRGDGKGRFTFAKRVQNMPNDLYDFQAGDLDRDGFLDVVALGVRELYIKRGIGSGPFIESVFSLSGVAQALELADVTRDGILDLAVAMLDPVSLVVYPGDGNGSFGAPIVAATDSGAGRFKLGDLNHDGWLDIVVDRGSDVDVILASGDGGWNAMVRYPSTIPWDTASGTILGDFNNDGDLDFLSWGGAMLFGDGRGGFGRPFPFALETPNGFGYDFNRDGLLDIVNGGHIFLNERRAVNRPPVANAGPDRSYLYHEQFDDDEWCERTAGSSDPDLHGLSYEWRDETGTPFTCAFPPHGPGTYTFTLTVRDGRGGQSTDSLRVTIAPAPEIVLHSSNYGEVQGKWKVEPDQAAASGRRFRYPDAGAPKVDTPAADPSGFVDVYFTPDPTQTYKLWVRLKADNNYWGNDSVWLQFSGAVGAAGQPAYRIGTTSGLAVNLEECSGCGVSGWGWEDDGWGAINRNGKTLRFPDGGRQRIRLQIREDGVSIDQIVFSAVKYRTTRPGSAKNDTVILPPIP